MLRGQRPPSAGQAGHAGLAGDRIEYPIQQTEMRQGSAGDRGMGRMRRMGRVGEMGDSVPIRAMSTGCFVSLISSFPNRSNTLIGTACRADVRNARGYVPTVVCDASGLAKFCGDATADRTTITYGGKDMAITAIRPALPYTPSTPPAISRSTKIRSERRPTCGTTRTK